MNVKTQGLPSALGAMLVVLAFGACAADLTLKPAPGNAVAITDASGASARLRVADTGEVWIPILATGAQQGAPVCSGAGGQLGPCPTNPGGGGFALPYAQTLSAAGALFALTNSGAGGALEGRAGHGAGVLGVNNAAAGIGVRGTSDQGKGVVGSSNDGTGVVGTTESTSGGVGVDGISDDRGTGIGVRGQSANGDGVQGRTTNGGSGVAGIHEGNGSGVYGSSVDGRGVYGESANGDAVQGRTAGAGSAVAGIHAGGGSGVYGSSVDGEGVHGVSTNGDGVQGRTTNGGSAVAGIHEGAGTGVYGSSVSGYAMNANGPATQALGAGGWAKALIQYSPTLAQNNDGDSRLVDAQIVRCFNSQLPAPQSSIPPCGFTVKNVVAADDGASSWFDIDVGFQVDDRFIVFSPGLFVEQISASARPVGPPHDRIRVSFFTSKTTYRPEVAGYIVVF